MPMKRCEYCKKEFQTFRMSDMQIHLIAHLLWMIESLIDELQLIRERLP